MVTSEFEDKTVSSTGFLKLVMNKSSRTKWESNSCFRFVVPEVYDTTFGSLYSAFDKDPAKSNYCSAPDGQTGFEYLCQYYSENEMTIKLTNVDQIMESNTEFKILIDKIAMPYSAVDLNMQVDVYSDPDCLTRSQVRKLTKVVPIGAQIPADKIELSTTEQYRSIAQDRSSNAIIIKFTPTTTMSKSLSGSLKLTMPLWYVSDSTPQVHYITDEDARKCNSDAFSVISDVMETNTLVIKYEYMREEFLSG